MLLRQNVKIGIFAVFRALEACPLCLKLATMIMIRHIYEEF